MRNGMAKFEAWQVFAASFKALGRAKVAVCLGVTESTAYQYGANPTTTGEKRCRNPLERLHSLLYELDMWGRGDVCRDAINYLRTAFEDAEPRPVVELKPTMSEEELADYQEVSAIHSAIERRESFDLVCARAESAKSEIDRTVAKYRKDCK